MKYSLYLLSIIALPICGLEQEVLAEPTTPENPIQPLALEQAVPAEPTTPENPTQPFNAPNLRGIRRASRRTHPLSRIPHFPDLDEMVERGILRASQCTHPLTQIPCLPDLNERVERGEDNPFKGLVSTTKKSQMTCQKIIYLNKERTKMASSSYSFR